MKLKIEIASLIIFLLMWCVLDYFIGQYICQLMKQSGAIVLIRDIIGAYTIPLIIGWAIVIVSWAYFCDKLDKK